MGKTILLLYCWVAKTPANQDAVKMLSGCSNNGGSTKLVDSWGEGCPITVLCCLGNFGEIGNEKKPPLNEGICGL